MAVGHPTVMQQSVMDPVAWVRAHLDLTFVLWPGLADFASMTPVKAVPAGFLLLHQLSSLLWSHCVEDGAGEEVADGILAFPKGNCRS